MPLDRHGLIDLGVRRYFQALNAHDLPTVRDALADDAVSDMVNAGYFYRGKAELVAHLADFLDTFPHINFHDFRPIADPQDQSLAVLFKVELTDHDGRSIAMRNTNFFFADAQGLIRTITIYTSQAVASAGFSVGSTPAAPQN